MVKLQLSPPCRSLSLNEGYIEPTAMARRHVAMAFAGRGSVVYGKAFDVVRVMNGATIDWNNLSSVEQNLDDIVLYEVKSTNRALPADFSGYFFSLSTAELLVAQSLGSRQFRFAFVDTSSKNVLDLSLTEMFSRMKGIYPAWSIRF